MIGFLLTDRRFYRYRFLTKSSGLERHHMKEMAVIGTPIGLINAVTLAAIASAMQTSGLGFIVPYDLSQAATVRVGLAAGRGDALAIRWVAWTALALGGVSIVSSSGFIWFGRELIIDSFLDLGDPTCSPSFPSPWAC